MSSFNNFFDNDANMAALTKNLLAKGEKADDLIWNVCELAANLQGFATTPAITKRYQELVKAKERAAA